MSFVIARPEALAAASAHLGGIDNYAQEYQALSTASGGVSRLVRVGVGRHCVAVAGDAATGWFGSSPCTGPTMNVEAP